MNIATLFSGVGTPELALKALGVEHKTIFACEIDKYARKTYLENNQEPNTFYEDVTKLDAIKYKNLIDILVGGFPCQAFSIAGKQLGFLDTRGTLFFDVARIIKECIPKVFILENVKGLISHDKPKKGIEIDGIFYKNGYPSHFNKEYDGHKKGIGKTLYTIENIMLDFGYKTIVWDVVNTKDYLVPQNRERIYIVGFKDEVEFEFAPKQELKLRLKDMLEDYVDEKYLLNQTNINLMNTIWGKDTRWRKMKNPIDGCAGAICATHSKGLPRGVIINNKEIQEKIYKEGTIKLEQVATLNIKGNDSIKRIYSGDGLCPSLTTMQGGHREPKVAIASGVIEIENDEARVKEAIKLGYKVAEEGDSINISVPSFKTRRGRVGRQVAQTLDTACNQVVFKIVDDTQGFDGVREYEEYSPTIRAGRSGLKWSQNNYIFRKLTPRECFRLQGFDDSFIFPQKMSDTQLYKQAGNGMSRNVLEMIFTKILTSYTKYIKDKK